MSAGRRTTALLLLAALLAAATRLGGLELAEFRFDEAWALDVAHQVRAGQALPPVGIGSSLGIPNPPFFVYLLALPLAVDPSPEAATAFVALLNVAAVLVLGWLARALVGPLAGGLATLLYAVAPWAVLFSRKIWAQDALPLFLLLALALLWLAVERTRPAGSRARQGFRWGAPALLVPSVVLLALATQLHLTAFALAPLWALALLAPGRRAVRAAFLALGGALAFTLYLPYLRWQAQHGWPLLGRASSGLGGEWSWDAVILTLDAMAGQPYSGLADLGAFGWLADAWLAVRAALLLALGLGLLRLLGTVAADPKRRWSALLLLGWLGLPVLAFVRPSVPLYHHYFVAVIPAGCVVAALGLVTLGGLAAPRASSWARLGRSVAGVAGVAGVALGTVLFAAFLQAVGSGRATDAYGPPLAARRAALALARAALAAPGAPVYLLGDEGDLAVYRALLQAEGAPAVFADNRRLLAVPSAGPAVYLVTDDAAPLARRLLDEWPAETLATQRPTTGPTTVRIARLPAGALDAALAAPGVQRVERQFANGMELLAVRAERREQTVQIALYWRVGEDTQGPMPQAFNHVLDARGERVAQADGPTFAPTAWPPGVVVLTPFEATLPSGAIGPFRLRTGLYHLDTLQRVPLRSGGDAVEVAIGAGAAP